jgi:hypothetical protein
MVMLKLGKLIIIYFYLLSHVVFSSSARSLDAEPTKHHGSIHTQSLLGVGANAGAVLSQFGVI